MIKGPRAMREGALQVSKDIPGRRNKHGASTFPQGATGKSGSPDLEGEIKRRCNIRETTGCQVTGGLAAHSEELRFLSKAIRKPLEGLHRILAYYLFIYT